MAYPGTPHFRSTQPHVAEGNSFSSAASRNTASMLVEPGVERACLIAEVIRFTRYKENRPAQSDASRIPLSQRVDPVAENDLAEVATGFD